MKNHPINNTLKNILRYTIYGIAFLLVIQIFSCVSGCISRAVKSAETKTVGFNSVNTIFVGPKETKEVEIGPEYGDWISIDPRCYWKFITKNPNGVAIKFQFRNGTETNWIPDNTDTYLGSELWTKTFRVKTREGIVRMIIKTSKIN